MKSTVTAPAPVAKRGIGFYLTLLLPVLVTEVAQSSLPQARASMPYLTLVGAPGLRFLETAPTPPVTARPAMGESSHNGPGWDADVAKKPALGTSLATPGNSTAAVEQKRDVIPAEKAITKVMQEESHPAAILPDDAAPKVKPEDFLPFFEFPGGSKGPGSASGAPAATSPGSEPLSTATYKEQ